MFDPVSEFRDAIRASGLEPPNVIEPGQFYRFPGINKGSGNKAGWCKLFEDGLGGCFGDWSSGITGTWQAKQDQSLSEFERTALERQVQESRRQAETERKEEQANAAKKAASIWGRAEPAHKDHPYLAAKHIDALGARLHKGELVIPMRKDKELQSLQFISAEGIKRFLHGGRTSSCYYSIGSPASADALCIVEGFATGATVHQATGYPVAVAFNAGNLESVALTLRKLFPELPIIICADDDFHTDGNPGITKARQAANATNARIVVPTFGDQRSADATDFNDMARLFGLEAVAHIIVKARSSESVSVSTSSAWPDPQPLLSKIDPKPYPLDALPNTVRAAVEEVQAFVKAPVPLVAASALAALSLAIQAHADVERAEKLTGPVGLFLLTIADSGERKSTCDGYFTQPIQEYEAKQAEESAPVMMDYKVAKEAWEEKCRGIKAKIRSLAKEGESSDGQEEALRNLENAKPCRPRVPRLVYGDATPEALKWNLAKAWPSGGVISSEAGFVFGAHGMGKESVMRNLATLNQLWDGADIATERRTSESFTVRGARLTMALQVQEATLRSFFERSGGLARGTGFLARFLVAWPGSTQGDRAFTDPP